MTDEQKTPVTLDQLDASARQQLLDELRASLTHDEVVTLFVDKRAAELADTHSEAAAAAQVDAEIVRAQRTAELTSEAAERLRQETHFADTLESGAFPVSLAGQPLASGCI